MLPYSFATWLDKYQEDIFNEQNSSTPAVKLDFIYHNYTTLTNYLKDINDNYPTLTHLYSIGKSARGLFWILFRFTEHFIPIKVDFFRCYWFSIFYFSILNRSGCELWVLAVSSTSPDRHVPGKAEIKYIGNIHGNEPIGKELILHFIQVTQTYSLFFFFFFFLLSY